MNLVISFCVTLLGTENSSPFSIYEQSIKGLSEEFEHELKKIAIKKDALDSKTYTRVRLFNFILKTIRFFQEELQTFACVIQFSTKKI